MGRCQLPRTPGVFDLLFGPSRHVFKAGIIVTKGAVAFGTEHSGGGSRSAPGTDNWQNATENTAKKNHKATPGGGPSIVDSVPPAVIVIVWIGVVDRCVAVVVGAVVSCWIAAITVAAAAAVIARGIGTATAAAVASSP